MNKRLIEKSKRVMRSIALLENRPELARQSDGEAIIVVALPNEAVGDVMQRMPVTDGPVNLVIASANSFEVLGMSKSGREDSAMVVKHTTSMGMLSMKLRRHPGRIIRLDVAPSGTSAQEITLMPELAYA